MLTRTSRFYFCAGLLITTFSCNVQSNQSESPKHPDRQEIANQMERSLKDEMLKIWYPQCIDKEFGGYLTGYTHDFQLTGEQQKMIVTQSRHLWVNAKSSQLYPEETHFKDGATHGFKFLRDVMWDKEYGGFYSLVSRDGKVLDESKNAYGNAFGIFSLAAHYAASKDPGALELAQKTFMWLEKNSHDPKDKGYFQHMNRDGSVIQRTSLVNSVAETGYKDQNSSIHLLEAFAELYQVWPDPLLRERLIEMLVLIRDRIVTEKGYMALFFTPDWKPVTFVDSSREVIEKHHGLDHVSFGHDIETAYLILEASHVLGLKDDPTTIEISKKMVDHTLRNGWDESVGGFYDEGYYFKGADAISITRDTKNWWAQAEGMNTLLIMADQYPKDPMRYYDKFVKQWQYIDKYLIDHEYGDWYPGGLDKEPEHKMSMKGHQWKATYHQFRAMVNCIQRLRGQGQS